MRCAAGELDRLTLPVKPLDVLAQQIVAESAAREWDETLLWQLMRGAWSFRDLTRAEFEEVLRMLAEGYTTRRGRHGALIYHDGVNHLVKGRKSARLTALTSGGTIPDTADYQVILEPQAQFVGTVNEDFAVESLQGDVFQLGNVSYRILRVEQGRIRVEDARGQPPSIPFWLGEAPGRSDELSASVARLRAELEPVLDRGLEAASAWLVARTGIAGPAALQLVSYLAAARAALGALPTQRTLIFERFFDEAGGMQLVIHSPFGSRINRAWGLSLRKRFCRSFNFELQAAATEDTIVLSLTTAHSFELGDVARYLHSNSVRPLLVQALCAAPMFPVRWRWSATIALALPRYRNGKKVPAPLARMAAEDLLSAVFPDQVACAENLPGELEIPDHPLVRQAIRDCLEEAMDIEGFERLLRGLESGALQVIARDLTEPSPLALEVLSARPYAFLDDAPLEERRTQAVISRRWLDPQSAADLGQLDAEAIARVRAEAWPDATSADELHDALLWLTYLTPAEVAGNDAWPALLAQLAAQRRVTRSRQRRNRAVGHRGAAAVLRRALPAGTVRAAGGDARCARGQPRGAGGAGGGGARAARGFRSRERGVPRANPGPAGDADRCGARGAAGGGLRHARRVQRRGRAGERVVRAAPAGAHPPLHGETAARGDRAHRGARLPALPVRLAARDAGGAHGGTGRGRRGAGAAGGLRVPGERLGDRDPAPPHQRVRAGLAR